MYNCIMDNEKYQVLSIEHLHSLGYDVEEMYPQVFWIKDFLTDQEIRDVKDIIEIATEEEWTHHYMEGLRMLSYQKFGRTDLDNLVEEGLLEITDGWVDKTLSFMDAPIRDQLNKKLSAIFANIEDVNPKGVGTIQRQYEGTPLKEHVDNHADPSLVYAAVMYINDDYTDGEIFFTKLGIEFKPNAGSLMIFATGELYEHGVRAPGPGPKRYVLPCFIGLENYYPFTNP